MRKRRRGLLKANRAKQLQGSELCRGGWVVLFHGSTGCKWGREGKGRADVDSQAEPAPEGKVVKGRYATLRPFDLLLQAVANHQSLNRRFQHFIFIFQVAMLISKDRKKQWRGHQWRTITKVGARDATFGDARAIQILNWLIFWLSWCGNDDGINKKRKCEPLVLIWKEYPRLGILAALYNKEHSTSGLTPVRFYFSYWISSLKVGTYSELDDLGAFPRTAS